MKYTATIIILFLLIGCKNTSKTNKNINSKTTTYQLIEKEFTHKGGKFTEYKELYLSCSIQDYFIKICESNVTSEQLTPYMNKSIQVEIEIKDGFLDHCDEIPEYAQSRTGTYVIIKKIIK